MIAVMNKLRIVVVMMCVGCGDDATVVDGGRLDAGRRDGGGLRIDGGSIDGGRDADVDAGAIDAGTSDASAIDAGLADAGLDGGATDGGAPDAGELDAGMPTGCPVGSAQLIEKVGFDAYAFCDAVRFALGPGVPDVPLAGLSICSNATCHPLDGTVGPTALIVRACMFIGDSMPTFYVPSDLAYDRANGDVSLRLGTEICDYVQWGPGPHDREAEAVAAGQWTAGTSAPVAEGADHLMRTGAAESGASWSALPGFP
jgi:hypothetical protein